MFADFTATDATDSSLNTEHVSLLSDDDFFALMCSLNIRLVSRKTTVRENCTILHFLALVAPVWASHLIHKW